MTDTYIGDMNVVGPGDDKWKEYLMYGIIGVVIIGFGSIVMLGIYKK